MRATETDALMMMRRGGTLVDAEASTASRGNDESGGIGKSFRKYSDVDEEVGEEEENERRSRGAGVPRLSVCFGANDRRFRETDWRRYGAVHLLTCAMANIVTLGVYGVLQQRIMTIPYSSGGKEGYQDAIFTSSIFLVFSNRLFSLVVGFVALAYTRPKGMSLFSREWWWPHSNLENYMCVALSNLISTLCQYEVLKYLTFAMSTLAKAAKILPTMLWGYVLHGKRFQASQYFSAIIVTAGCFLFLSNSSIAANGHRSQFQTQFYFRRSRTPPTSLSMPPPPPTVSLGHISDDGSFLDALGKFRWIAYDSIFVGVDILLVYLAADGFTSSYQQRLFRVQKTSMFDQMFWMCFFGTIFSGVWLICSGQLGYTLQYLQQYPKIGPDIVYLSLSSAFSQVAITYTIRAFGAVALASILTVRQVVSIALNAFVFHESLVPLQWCGMCLILLPALFCGGWFKKELESGPTSFSHWDLKKLSTDSVQTKKTPDGREHFYSVSSTDVPPAQQ